MDVPAAFFDAFMYPLETGGLGTRRARLLPGASGVVLEVGAGTGVNLAYYPCEGLEDLYVMDLSVSPRVYHRSDDGCLNPTILEGDVQHLPFEDGFFDTVVFTLVFCSVEDPERGLAEVHRVLKPDGRIIFIEHVLPEKKPVLRTSFRAITPMWKLISGNCHLDRDTLSSIRAAGFEIETLERFANGIMIAGTGRKAVRRASL
ncbi:MAG: class I SAM-dependent methyltransferase [Spirochaetaceae bacterium]